MSQFAGGLVDVIIFIIVVENLLGAQICEPYYLLCLVKKNIYAVSAGPATAPGESGSRPGRSILSSEGPNRMRRARSSNNFLDRTC